MALTLPRSMEVLVPSFLDGRLFGARGTRHVTDTSANNSNCEQEAGHTMLVEHVLVTVRYISCRNLVSKSVDMTEKVRKKTCS